MNYFDCHADTLTEIPPSENLRENSCCLDLKRVQKFGGCYTQIFALWADLSNAADAVYKADDADHGKRRRAALEEAFLELYRRAVLLLTEQQEHIILCRNAADMQLAHREGKAAAFLSVEDISIMGTLAEHIRELGIRFAMLTWNYENVYACGAATDQSKGLTKEGRAMVKRLLEQQIVIDISHLSDRGAADIFGMTGRPVMASHSNVREICEHPRNLNKSQIQELVRRKGLLGMNFYDQFIGVPAKAADLLRHMDAVLNLGGEDILAIGSDFDGCGDRFLEGIAGVQSVPYLKKIVEQEGFGSRIAEKIFYRNAERFLTENVI